MLYYATDKIHLECGCGLNYYFNTVDASKSLQSLSGHSFRLLLDCTTLVTLLIMHVCVVYLFPCNQILKKTQLDFITRATLLHAQL